MDKQNKKKNRRGKKKNATNPVTSTLTAAPTSSPLKVVDAATSAASTPTSATSTAYATTPTTSAASATSTSSAASTPTSATSTSYATTPTTSAASATSTSSAASPSAPSAPSTSSTAPSTSSAASASASTSTSPSTLSSAAQFYHTFMFPDGIRPLPFVMVPRPRGPYAARAHPPLLPSNPFEEKEGDILAYEALCDELAQYTDFNRVNQIFEAAVESLTLPPSLLPTVEQAATQFEVETKWFWEYKYDELTYQGVISVEPNRDSRGVWHFPVNIRLSNDGFLYRHHRQLEARATTDLSRVHHHLQGWVDVDENRGRYFEPIVGFAQGWLGTRQICMHIKYNVYHQRMDMYFSRRGHYGGSRLQVSFEPGAPIALFDDPWQEWEEAQHIPNTEAAS